MSRRTNFLDADDNFREQNLRFVRNDFEDNVNQYFSGSGGVGRNNTAPPQRDFKIVQPKPGNAEFENRRAFFLQLGLNRGEANSLANRSFCLEQLNINFFKERRNNLRKIGISQNDIDMKIISKIRDEINAFESQRQSFTRGLSGVNEGGRGGGGFNDNFQQVSTGQSNVPKPPRNINWNNRKRGANLGDDFDNGPQAFRNDRNYNTGDFQRNVNSYDVGEVFNRRGGNDFERQLSTNDNPSMNSNQNWGNRYNSSSGGGGGRMGGFNPNDNRDFNRGGNNNNNNNSNYSANTVSNRDGDFQRSGNYSQNFDSNFDDNFSRQTSNFHQNTSRNNSGFQFGNSGDNASGGGSLNLPSFGQNMGNSEPFSRRSDQLNSGNRSQNNLSDFGRASGGSSNLNAMLSTATTGSGNFNQYASQLQSGNLKNQIQNALSNFAGFNRNNQQSPSAISGTSRGLGNSNFNQNSNGGGNQTNFNSGFNSNPNLPGSVVGMIGSNQINQNTSNNARNFGGNNANNRTINNTANKPRGGGGSGGGGGGSSHAGNAVRGGNSNAGNASRGANNNSAMRGVNNSTGNAVRSGNNTAGNAVRGGNNNAGNAARGGNNNAGNAVRGGINPGNAPRGGNTAASAVRGGNNLNQNRLRNLSNAAIPQNQQQFQNSANLGQAVSSNASVNRTTVNRVNQTNIKPEPSHAKLQSAAGNQTQSQATNPAGNNSNQNKQTKVAAVIPKGNNTANNAIKKIATTRRGGGNVMKPQSHAARNKNGSQYVNRRNMNAGNFNNALNAVGNFGKQGGGGGYNFNTGPNSMGNFPDGGPNVGYDYQGGNYQGNVSTPVNEFIGLLSTLVAVTNMQNNGQGAIQQPVVKKVLPKIDLNQLLPKQIEKRVLSFFKFTKLYKLPQPLKQSYAVKSLTKKMPQFVDDDYIKSIAETLAKNEMPDDWDDDGISTVATATDTDKIEPEIATDADAEANANDDDDAVVDSDAAAKADDNFDEEDNDEADADADADDEDKKLSPDDKFPIKLRQRKRMWHLTKTDPATVNKFWLDWWQEFKPIETKVLEKLKDCDSFNLNESVGLLKATRKHKFSRVVKERVAYAVQMLKTFGCNPTIIGKYLCLLRDPGFWRCLSRRETVQLLFSIHTIKNSDWANMLRGLVLSWVYYQELIDCEAQQSKKPESVIKNLNTAKASFKSGLFHLFVLQAFEELKSFKVNTNEKYFINVCQAEEIPAPEDITEEQLTEILQSEMPGNFRIAMSISDPRTTKDKSNNSVDVCDIAINPKFFVKCELSVLFKDFFLTLIAEALSEKYNVQIQIEKTIILSNRKFIGKLVPHRIRNNDVQRALKSSENQSQDAIDAAVSQNRQQKSAAKNVAPLVQEIDAKEVEVLQKLNAKLAAEEAFGGVKKKISTVAANEPEYKLRARVREEKVQEIQAEFYLPKCISSQEVHLDIGEDRILLESIKHGYMFDKFVNYRLNQDRARAIFDKTNKMLQIRIPVFVE